MVDIECELNSSEKRRLRHYPGTGRVWPVHRWERATGGRWDAILAVRATLARSAYVPPSHEHGLQHKLIIDVLQQIYGDNVSVFIGLCPLKRNLRNPLRQAPLRASRSALLGRNPTCKAWSSSIEKMLSSPEVKKGMDIQAYSKATLLWLGDA